MYTINSILHHFTALKRRAATLHRINALTHHRATAPQHYRATAPPRQHRTAHTTFYYCPHYNTTHVKN